MSLVRRNHKGIRPVFVTIMLGLLLVLVAACSTSQGTAQGSTQPDTNGVAQVNQAGAAVDVNKQDASATLHWDYKTHALTVKVDVDGLPPNSVHPNHIHLGVCSSNGPVKYPLKNIVANGEGDATATTVIQGVAGGIPASGWYLNIHHGPGLATADQMAAIYCGNIANPSVKSDHDQDVKITLHQFVLNGFTTVSKIDSTVPANGDVNPYGVAVVQKSVGNLVKGHILVSNFNNGANLQGTGTTIVQISPNGSKTTFAQLTSAACPDGIGLTTALVELKRGWVIVGSLPAADGKFANVKAGCLIVLNSKGQVVKTFSGSPINGPWDASVVENGDGDQATLFVTNILNGVVPANNNVVNQGTVVRITLHVPEQNGGTPSIKESTVIATGFAEKTDPAALVIGPTGVALGKQNILYVADTINNRIIAIPDALNRTTVSHADKHVLTANGSLNAELGLTVAWNGNILTVNGGDGNIIEITPEGKQIVTKPISTMGTPPGAGCLFGLAVAPSGYAVYFVDDCTNQLNSFH
ncbi:MAG TPA: CHRD domain-containing protein [Ktedonobacteraceae bacterium]|nr:CHRD domain-containing protein [Ktedonobacteraceae bacterium]